MNKIVKISLSSDVCKFANVEVPEDFDAWPEEKKQEVFAGIWKADHLDDYHTTDFVLSACEFVQGQKYGIPRLCFTVDAAGQVTRDSDDTPAVTVAGARDVENQVTIPEDPNALAMAITEALTLLVGSPPPLHTDGSVWYAGNGVGTTHLKALDSAARQYLGDVAPDQEMAIAVLRAAVKKK